MYSYLPLHGLNLQEMQSDFVLESKKIDIPGYPDAFNPSIIRWNDSLLMSFRIVPNPKEKYNCNIGLVWLDEEFNIISHPQILETVDPNSSIPARIDDARLIQIGEALYLVYADNKEEKISRGGYRVYIAELIYNGTTFTVLDQECISTFPKQNKNRREKNWTPFNFQDHLLLSYSLDPHIVFLPHRGSNTCQTFCQSKSQIEWDWGELRGGTPALPLNETEYLGFFHSTIDTSSLQSKRENSAHYFMGAYTFSNSPPFTLTRISPTPIVGKDFYENDIYKPYWKPVTVVFPCGLLIDENYVWITYGQHDHEAWITKLDKRKLLDSLIPVL